MKRIVITILAFILIVVSAGCIGEEARIEKVKKREAVDRLIVNQPAHLPEYSMDRYLMNQYLKRFSDADKVCYLYLCGEDGRPRFELQIKGKTASLDKRLTSRYDTDDDELPDEQGMFGSSGGEKQGCITTEDIMVVFGGGWLYVWSEPPLRFGEEAIPRILVVKE
ncbi:hypothetical protein GF359_02690 [candidate division WOR-3 bacterium]|uniref:Lipoprotein n=1 Tax=candidate division WOR-3 bacterium TaxID=2052148 RepID=A0A9D5KA63_UNCW3|nr:hypothetical protein [candidate division WOR-3 bacterium]MBD3364101.1 hypothetical protein [candidate division WOR-3 bacterium]